MNNTKPEPTKGAKIFAGIFAVVILLVIIIAVASGGGQNKTGNSKQVATSEVKATSNTISQSDAESYCEDANLLQNYVDIDATDIVTLDYNPTFIGNTASYTKDGKPIASLYWTGKDKNSGNPVTFDCYLSRDKDNKLQLNRMEINGSGITLIDFYSKDGTKQEI